MKANTLDKILEYFDVEEDDGEKTCYIKKGYLFRYEGFETFNIRLMSVDEHHIFFMTDESDWKEPIDKAYKTLEDCKLYKLEEISLA